MCHSCSLLLNERSRVLINKPAETLEPNSYKADRGWIHREFIPYLCLFVEVLGSESEEVW